MMISIEVKNASDVIRNQKGWFVSKALSFAGVSELAVERLIADQLLKVLKEQGVEAEIKVYRHSPDRKV
jgi:hypothetical protein